MQKHFVVLWGLKALTARTVTALVLKRILDVSFVCFLIQKNEKLLSFARSVRLRSRRRNAVLF